MRSQTEIALPGVSAVEVIEQLLNRIKSLEFHLSEQRNWNDDEKHIRTREVVKRLRLHQVYLVHAGSDRLEDVQQRLADDPGALAALASVFELDNAPLSRPIIETVRSAFGGNARW